MKEVLLIQGKRCESKVVYDDLARAADAALRQLEKYRRQQRPYQCEACTKFHLTSHALTGLDGVSPDYIRQIARLSEETERGVTTAAMLILENARLREQLRALRSQHRALRKGVRYGTTPQDAGRGL